MTDTTTPSASPETASPGNASPANASPGNAAPQQADASLSAVATILREQQQIAAREQKRLRRRAFWWRLIAILVILGVVLTAIFAEDGLPKNQIARIAVNGVIVDDPKRDALLDKLGEQSRVKAVIVRIDSPGGTTVGGEALYESLRKLAAKKPVVAVMGEVAASAAYITALATDHIVARGNSITASVGVIFTAPNFYRAIDSLGIEMLEVKSGAQKAEPSPYKPVDVTKLASERVLVADSFEWFLGLVRERRGLDDAGMERIKDGRILTGRMALEQGLVDQIGGESEAVAWLSEDRGIDKTLPIVDREPEEPEPGLMARLLDDVFGDASLSSAVRRFRSGPTLMSISD